MSVRLKIFPPEILFNILVVAVPTWGFLDFAPTTIPITSARVLIAGFKKLFQVF